MKLKILKNNILLVTFKTQKELTFTMCRPQEYYEASSSKLRGNVFSFEKLVEHYTDDNGYISYFNYWSGFNLPGEVFTDFLNKFDLTMREQKLYNLVKSHINKPYYLIACKKEDNVTLEHELVHAHYYLNPTYKQAANILVKHMNPELRKDLTRKLKFLGYTNAVIVDEINAYMATSSTKYLKEDMHLDITYKDVKPFKELAETVLRD